MKAKQGRFQIFGRVSYEKPLTFVQEIRVKESVEDETLAAVGDDGWVELIAVPARALIHVTGKKEDG